MAIKRALISVSDKRELAELGQALSDKGVEIIASGGTKKALKEAGVAVQGVAEFTGAPEILGGRVKTLHPRVHGGILAKATSEHQAELEGQGIPYIDLVVVNLYPFVKTVARPGVSHDEAIEQIDIGGPTLIRAAAKNSARVTVVVDPSDYASVIESLDGDGPNEDQRRRLAAKAFAHTAAYDAAISNYFQQQIGPESGTPECLSLQLQKTQELRYGENPHQQGGFYSVTGSTEFMSIGYRQLQGTTLSYNNFLDADAAWALVQDLPGVAAAVIKHTNPCGAASLDQGSIAEAFRRARATDPVSAFGGIVAVNQPVTEELAAELREMFLEVVIAPDFAPEALTVLKRKKKLRLLTRALDDQSQHPWRLRSAWGGLLLQQADQSAEDVREAKTVSSREPSSAELRDLQLAWIACKHVKSNAIVFVKDGQLLGVGAGQMSRVDAAKLAATKSQVPLTGSVVASDAFFPFRDGVDAAAEVGATAIVEPGGSVRDDEVIAAANEHGLALVFTGVRHFRH